MKQDRYITFAEFVHNSGMKEATIKRRIRQDGIAGITKTPEGYHVLSGTRYPCDIHRYKLKDSADRRYVLLKMISEYRYISHIDLRIEHAQFKTMLAELLAAELIQPNHLANEYGANAYDCTLKGDELLKKNTRDSKQELSQLMVNVSRIALDLAAIVSKYYVL